MRSPKMRPPSLPELQSAFAQGVFDDNAPALEWLASPPQRFAVYRNSVQSNLRGTLSAIYPVVRRLTGEKFFEQASTIYVRQQPSVSGDLHRYGKSFADFLAAYPPSRSLRYLPDVARLEWFWHEAFHSADAQPANLDALAAIAHEDYGRVRFHLQSGCRLLHSGFPVHRIWEYNQPGYSGAEQSNLDDGEAWLAVYRFNYEVRVAPVSHAEFVLLDAIASGSTLESALTRAAGVDPGINFGAMLARFHAEQIITGFSLESNQ